MVLMLDNNIIIDHLEGREPFCEKSRLVCLLGITGEAETFISVNMLTDIYYVLSRTFGKQEAQKKLEEDLSFLGYVGISPEDATIALARHWPDFEDSLVARCAEKIAADYIITRNVDDFSRSAVEAITPDELFERLARKGFHFEEIDW